MSEQLAASPGPLKYRDAGPQFQRREASSIVALRKKNLLGSVLRLFRQKRDWSLPLLGHVAWGVSANFFRQLQIFRVLKHPAFAAIVQSDPKFPYRYLNRDYLFRGLAQTDRASAFLHHYQRLSALLPANILRRILLRDYTLLEISKDANAYRIAMGLSRRLYYEGELSLNLEVNGTIAFILSFTIVPGRLVGVDAPDALLITRLQGIKGCHQEIYDATKSLNEVAPPALLVAALQGIAAAFQIQNVAGISATRQCAYCEGHAASFKEAYDNFFDNLGITRNKANFYSSPIPLVEKPLASIKKGHKTRTRRKREFKQQVAASVHRRLAENCSVEQVPPILDVSIWASNPSANSAVFPHPVP